MAFGSIDLTIISRAQDYSGIKQNEDNRSMVAQTNITQDIQKTTEQHIREVHSSDDSDWHQRNPDAKEKGSAEYSGDGGRRRKGSKPQDKVVVKGKGSEVRSFDMKI